MNLFAQPLGLLAGAVVGLGVFVAVFAVVGRPPRAAGPAPARRPARSGDGSRKRLIRTGVGVLVGLLVLLGTHWIVAAVSVGLLVAYWDRLVGGGSQERIGIQRLEALASWTESLRDTIAGAIGLEGAIPASATNAAPAIRPSLNLLVDRLRIREPLPNALLRFADDIDDPSADVICAALVLNARLRGPGLRDVLTALADSAREELDLRRRIEASRRSIRRSVQLVLIIVLGVMGLLAILNRNYVAPYASLLGQLVLLIVVAMLAAGLMWLRSLAAAKSTGRFLVGAAGGDPTRPAMSDVA